MWEKGYEEMSKASQNTFWVGLTHTVVSFQISILLSSVLKKESSNSLFK